MSKRSRRERKARQQERALAQGDFAVLESLVEQSPRSAVALLSRALATANPASDSLAAPKPDLERAPQLEALAVRLCRRLRQVGEPVHALAVATAGTRRTPALRMEEALAAFATGNDEVTAQIAAHDEAVAAALGPLLQAVRGEVVAPSAAAAVPLRALHAAARAVAYTVRGETDQARAVVRHIPVAARRAVLAEEIGAAAGLQAPESALDALLSFARSPNVPRDAEVRRLMAAEAILGSEQLAALPPNLAADPILRRRVVPARLAAATSPGTVAEMIRQVGVDVFDASERATAALYFGFTQLRAEPAAASRTFDRAIDLGADLIEALRGKALAGLAISHGPGKTPPREAFREAAVSADRLARALERRPRAGPLAATASRLSAMSWIEAGDARGALASIARARPLAGGKLRDALDLLEVDALALRSPADAERRLEALLAQAPGNVEAWKRRAELAAERGHVERADAILVEAAEATNDPELAAAAREIRGERGQIAPFEGMIPGAATAGVLAKELERVIAEDGDPFPLAATCRDALGPAARAAFDAASVVIAATHGPNEKAREPLRAAVAAWRGSARDLARLSALAVLVDLGDELVAASRILHGTGGDDLLALTAIAEALAVAGRGELVGRLLPRIAAGLPRDRIAFFKGLAEGKPPGKIPGVPNPEQAVRELDLALAPEFSIAAFLREHDECGEDESPGLSTPRTGSIFTDLLEALGIPAAEMRALSPEKVRGLERRLLEISRHGPGPKTMEAIVDILNESGIEPRPLHRHGSRPGE